MYNVRLERGNIQSNPDPVNPVQSVSEISANSVRDYPQPASLCKAGMALPAGSMTASSDHGRLAFFLTDTEQQGKN